MPSNSSRQDQEEEETPTGEMSNRLEGGRGRRRFTTFYKASSQAAMAAAAADEKSMEMPTQHVSRFLRRWPPLQCPSTHTSVAAIAGGDVPLQAPPHTGAGSGDGLHESLPHTP
jgi:hypothetical protein